MIDMHTPHIYVILYGLSEESINYLDSCARIRKITRSRLMRKIMRTVIKEKLVLSVLDDDSRPSQRKQYQRTFVRKKYAYAGKTNGRHDDALADTSPRRSG